MADLIKYPRTAHLFDSGGTATTSDDLVLPDLNVVVNTFCDGTTTVTIEEKVDGANLGISVDPQTRKIMVQNRSHYVSGNGGNHAQFNRLHEWTALHQKALYELLGKGNAILYGEWLVAKHSIPYNRLPGHFIAFDIYDRTMGKFYSRQRFHEALEGTGIPVVPVIYNGVFARTEAKNFRQRLIQMLDTRSAFRDDDGPVEGIVLRVDSDPTIDGDNISWLQSRFKVVRPDFVRGCQGGHWTRRKMEKQRVDYELQANYLNRCYLLSRNDSNQVSS